MRILRAIIFFGALAAGLRLQGQTPSYVYFDLGVPASLSGDATAFSYACGINDAGTIVGTAGSNSTYLTTAIIYANGTMTDLGAQLAGSSFQYSYAYGINQAGDIVGSFYESAADGPQAFLYASGQFTNLGALSPSAQSTAYTLNNSDQVVGTSLDASGVEHGFVYSGGTMHDLGFLETGTYAFSAALGINDSGVVVGDSEKNTAAFGGDIPHGFYTTSYTANTGLVDMGFEMIQSGGFTYYDKEIAYAIDNSGTIIGGTCPVCPGQAFIDTNGVFTYLGVLPGDDSSYATAKNDSGQIVGASFVENGSYAASNQTYIPGANKFETDRRAFLYQNGRMYDLNAVTTNIPSGWTLVEADAINHSGQIVGYAIQGTIAQAGTVAHAFLLNPVQPAKTFSQWESSYSISSAATATPQNDGVPNLLKYLYNINPARPMMVSERAAMPVFAASPATGDLTLTYRQYASETGITIQVQISPDLKTWTTMPKATSPTAGSYTLQPTGALDPNTGDPYMKVDFKPAGVLPRQYIRLNVTQP